MRYWKDEVIWELNSFMGLIELPFQLLVFGVLNTGLITEFHRGGGGKGDFEFIARLDQRQYGLRTNISVISPRLASHNRSPVAFTPSQEIFFNFSALYDAPYYSQGHAVLTPETFRNFPFSQVLHIKQQGRKMSCCCTDRTWPSQC